MSFFQSSAYAVLGERLKDEGWTREFLAQLCAIRLLPETHDCPEIER